MTDYRSRGAIFPKQDKQGKQPDMTGYIEVTGDQMRRLVEMSKAGQEVKLQLSAWNETAKDTGRPFVSLSAQAYMKGNAPQSSGNMPNMDDIPY
jgi:hypothetical protein